MKCNECYGDMNYNYRTDKWDCPNHCKVRQSSLGEY